MSWTSRPIQGGLYSFLSPNCRRPPARYRYTAAAHTDQRDLDYIDVPSIQQRVQILYHDRDLIVVNKPPGLDCQPTNNVAYEAGTISELLKLLKPHLDLPCVPRPLHRLDKPVTGVLMIPVTFRAAQHFSEVIRERRVTKEYLAIVSGDVRQRMRAKEGTIETWLRKKGRMTEVCGPPTQAAQRHGTPPRRKTREVIDKGPTLCTTDWEVLDYSRKSNLTLLSLHLMTGFYHQLRVQCASVLGTPIVGDTKYDRELYNARGLLIQAGDASTERYSSILLHSSYVTVTLPRWSKTFRDEGKAQSNGTTPSEETDGQASSAQGNTLKRPEILLAIRAPPPPNFIKACQDAGLKLGERKYAGIWTDRQRPQVEPEEERMRAYKQRRTERKPQPSPVARLLPDKAILPWPAAGVGKQAISADTITPDESISIPLV